LNIPKAFVHIKNTIAVSPSLHLIGSDLILEFEDYNHNLKQYILENDDKISKILFTSSKGCNSAYETFKIIMGPDFNNIKAKLITNVPSPSGSSNTAWFNVNNDSTLGLHPDLFNFLKINKNEYLSQFEERWERKKIKKASKSKDKLPATPKGLLVDFKVWSYKKVLPSKIQ